MSMVQKIYRMVCLNSVISAKDGLMRIFFSVGEPSGDLHASNLIRRLKSHDPAIECVGYGGPKMAAEGCQLHFELTGLAVMFISKVLANLRLFFGLIGAADRYFRSHQVDAVVLIDYSGFNWWIARKAKRNGIPVFYYGVPQVWAWGPWRIRKIRKFVDHILCKLPFEEAWFAAKGCRAQYVGHPYFDELNDQHLDSSFIDQLEINQQPVLTLLPGSRDQEVVNSLPILLDAAEIVARHVQNIRVFVACYNKKQYQIAERIIQQHRSIGMKADRVNSDSDNTQVGLNVELDVELFHSRTPELMKAATVCLACSGSVSLELLYHRKPTVIVYKIAPWAMLVQAVLIRVRYITLVNLIAAEEIRRRSWRPYDPDADTADAVMPEYLTSANPAKLVAGHLINWIQNPQKRKSTVQRLDQLAKKYGQPGASAKVADYILQELDGRIQKPKVVNDDRIENDPAPERMEVRI